MSERPCGEAQPPLGTRASVDDLEREQTRLRLAVRCENRQTDQADGRANDDS